MKKYNKQEPAQSKSPSRPDYKKIYTDLITLKYPHLMEKCRSFLEKESLVSYDVLQLSSIITCRDDRETLSFNARHKCYDLDTIMRILDYQKKYGCSNQQLAGYFSLSRNTVTKWKKKFL
ncbi:helix-turn-helix domain-containing protein [Chryseobacterium sp. CBSDS_008]|uniref:helix-turn-helix domain-containing protein n=1 Tax=Chryseobacterium sp. CBSDS_008 TaxID=3415265 RepID=UPI003CF6280D